MKSKSITLQILIDLAYGHHMKDHQLLSLAKQIRLILQSPTSPIVHLCGVDARLSPFLQIQKYGNEGVHQHSQGIKQILANLKREPIYLSPDAPVQLEAVGQEKIYIMGGLVDRSIIKNASLNRAIQLQMPAYSLPIRQYMKNRICLNLDQTVSLLKHYQLNKDWKEAFNHSAPKRFKRQSEGG